MGKVYRARQLSLNRIVALKLIHAGRFAGPDELARFGREAEAAASLDHPNIVHIYEVGQLDNQPYFTMKLVEGQSLSRWNSNCPARDKKWFRAVARLVSVVARALHHAHKRGVMHRDLKPGNILLDQQGEPFIVDFGLSRLMDLAAEPRPAEGRLGTVGYMAPEQLASSARDLTTAVDIYALGCILQELLTGIVPLGVPASSPASSVASGASGEEAGAKERGRLVREIPTDTNARTRRPRSYASLSPSDFSEAKPFGGLDGKQNDRLGRVHLHQRGLHAWRRGDL